MNDELKAKYNRIANDPSQLEMFKNDQIDINTTSQNAIAALQAALEREKVFEATITVKEEYGGGYTLITNPLPSKLTSGDHFVKIVHQYYNSGSTIGYGIFKAAAGVYHLLELGLGDNFANNTLYTINSSDLTIKNVRRLNGTALYMHAIDPFHSGGGGFVISTRSTRYTSMSDVVSDFRSDYTGTTRILSARYGYQGGTKTVVDMVSSSDGITVYYLNGGTISSATISASSTISADYAIRAL